MSEEFRADLGELVAVARGRSVEEKINYQNKLDRNPDVKITQKLEALGLSFQDFSSPPGLENLQRAAEHPDGI